MHNLFKSKYTDCCNGFFFGFNHLHDHCRSDWVGKELTSNFPTPESLGLPSQRMMTGLEGGTILQKMTHIDGNLRASP